MVGATHDSLASQRMCTPGIGLGLVNCLTSPMILVLTTFRSPNVFLDLDLQSGFHGFCRAGGIFSSVFVSQVTSGGTWYGAAMVTGTLYVQAPEFPVHRFNHFVINKQCLHIEIGASGPFKLFWKARRNQAGIWRTPLVMTPSCPAAVPQHFSWTSLNQEGFSVEILPYRGVTNIDGAPLQNKMGSTT